MSPLSHLFLSWTVAAAGNLNQKERTTVMLAGILPDLDGAGLMLDIFHHGPDQQLQFWSRYHHVFGHNIGFGLIITCFAYIFSKQRVKTSLLVFGTFHLHLLCDLAGSKGPEGYQWPIPYLLPFSDAWQWVWQYQWALNAWPNFLITGVALMVTLYLAWGRGISPLEIISQRANRIFVETIRNRFGHPGKPN